MDSTANPLSDEITKSQKSRSGHEGKRRSRQKIVEPNTGSSTPASNSKPATVNESPATTVNAEGYSLHKSKGLDIFSNASILEHCVPIFLSHPTMQLFSIVPDETVTKSSPTVILAKADIIRDMQLRAAVSDFSVKKLEINNYSGDEILLVYDADFKFGENFLLVLSEETKTCILNPTEAVSIEKSDKEEDSKTEDREDELDEANDSVAEYRPKLRKMWINLGSDRDVNEMNVFEARAKVHTIFQRYRRDFGSSVRFTDLSAADATASTSVVSTTDRAPDILISESDKCVSNSQTTCERGTNTDWKYPRNAFTQYTPRMPTNEEVQSFYSCNGAQLDVGKHFKVFEQCLLENTMYNFLSNDYESLAPGDETYDTKADNTFKEFLTFTDLKYSKDKAITNIRWHPTIKGLVAMSVAERYIFDLRVQQVSRIQLTPSYIICWCFADRILPQLLLEAPDDILCFQFNPTDPHIVAAGCSSGMVVLWDIEKYLDDLRTALTRIKARNKVPLFPFDEGDLNKVPISPFCCMSNIEASHTSPVMDLNWIPDHFEVNRLGYCLENTSAKCVQLVTCGLNQEILFWDIRAEKSPLAVDKTRDAIIPPKNVPQTFLQLDLKWKPFLRVHLFRSDGGCNYSPTKFCMKEVQGDRRLLATVVDDPNAKGVSGKARPLQGASTYFYAGTEDGDLVYIDWMPQKDQDTGKMQTPKPIFSSPQHDGAISFLARSPFDATILLVVGGWTWSLWKEDVNTGPILGSGHAAKPLTGGSWSPTRPSVFYICRADGSLEVWDLLDKTHEPAMVQSISANALSAVSLWNLTKRQLIAIGDVQGALQILVVPRRMRSPLGSELANWSAYLAREIRRHEFVQARWHIREQERFELEAEQKRKAGIAVAVTLTEDESMQKERVEYEQYLQEEHAFLRSCGLLVEKNIQ